MAESDLHISKRLQKLLPPLTGEERKQLKANIEADGRVTDPILYWHDGTKNIVADGMHRFDIARRGDIPYKAEPIVIGDTYEDVELWILNRQLGRRNLLSPQAIRKIRGELYIKLRRADKGHGVQRASTKGGPGGQNVPPLSAAETVADIAGVDERTIKRDGARVETLKKCTDAVQKGVNTGKFKPSDADLNLIAKLTAENQNTIARDMRNEEAGSVKESMKARGIKPPGKKKSKPKLAKKLDKKACYKDWDRAIGPLLRVLDKIARDVGEWDCASHTVIHGQLQACTDEMAEWLGVKL